MSVGSVCASNNRTFVITQNKFHTYKYGYQVQMGFLTFLVSVSMSTTFPFLKLSPKVGANGINVLSTKPGKTNKQLGEDQILFL